MSLGAITPKADSRAILAGKTGCGKTTLARHILLQSGGYQVCIDPKGNLKLPGLVVESVGELWSGQDRVILRLDPLAGPVEYDRVLESIYKRGRCTLYIDELYGLSKDARYYPEWLRAIYSRGRERKIRVIACTQRPVWVPLYCLSECEYYYSFELLLDKDRKRMSEFMGANVLVSPTDYEFWYYSTRGHEQAVRRRLTITKGGQ